MGTMEPGEMIRLWHAAEALKAVLTVGLWAVAGALSIIMQDEAVPAVERFVWRLVGKG